MVARLAGFEDLCCLIYVCNLALLQAGYVEFATAWTKNRAVALLRPLLRGIVRAIGSRPMLSVYEVHNMPLVLVAQLWPSMPAAHFICLCL